MSAPLINYAANKLDRLRGQIARALEEIPFRQHRLLEPAEFVTYLRQRGFDIAPAHLEVLEREGLLFPLYAKSARSSAGHAGVDGCYHPYQLWLADRVFRVLHFPLPPMGWWTSSEGDISEMVKRHRRWVRGALAELSRDEEVVSYYKLLCFLLVLDPYYLPLIRGGLRLSPGQTVYQWRAWREGVDVAAAYQEAGLTLDELAEWHDKLVIGANRLDPARRWYLVVRYARYAARQELELVALWAQDYYEMAEMLRRFAQECLGEKLPTAAQVIFGPADSIQGVVPRLGEVDFQGREALAPILAAFGLSPHPQVVWLAEDEAEASFVSHFMEGLGLSLEAAGVEVAPLSSEAALTKASARLAGLEERLAQLPPEVAVLVTMTADPEAEAILGREKERGRPASYHLWARGFLEDNFPDETFSPGETPAERGRGLAERLLSQRQTAAGPLEPSLLTPIERWLEQALAGRFGDFCLSPKPEPPSLRPQPPSQGRWSSREGLLSPENAPQGHD